MNYLEATSSRVRFLEYLYEEASAPFCEALRKIETREPPFEWPAGHEEAEPPFLDEWVRANDALDLLGQLVASSLAATLKLYVESWIGELEKRAGKDQLQRLELSLPDSKEFKKGFLAAYRAYCEKLEIYWMESGADLELLEQLILARNSSQHPEDIASVRVRQSKTESERFPNGYFADEVDVAMNGSLQRGRDSMFWQPPRLGISGEKLAKAFRQVEAFCTWIDRKHPLRPSGAS